MKKIDHRIHYIMMTDTETANTLMGANGSLDMSSVLVYDIGWQVIDKRGTNYEQKSYLVKEIFEDEAELMKSAYYAKKIPQYLKEVAEGTRIVASFYDIRKDFVQTMEEYGTTTVCAHNARFDCNALNITERWLTKSKYRYFFPYGTEVWDTMKGARAAIGTMPTYKAFCEENGYMTKHKTPRVRLTAEILYRFISKDLEFKESHTGLEDVDIERQILAYCFKRRARISDMTLYKGE